VSKFIRKPKGNTDEIYPQFYFVEKEIG